MNEPQMPFGERRLHERKACSRIIQIDDLEMIYHGHLRDLALGGAFIEPPVDTSTDVGQKLILTIPFGLKKDRLTLNATVAWVRPQGIGVRFVKQTP